MNRLCFLFSEEPFSFVDFSVHLSFLIYLWELFKYSEYESFIGCTYCIYLFLGCGVSLKVYFSCFTKVLNFNVQSSVFVFLIVSVFNPLFTKSFYSVIL